MCPSVRRYLCHFGVIAAPFWRHFHCYQTITDYLYTMENLGFELSFFCLFLWFFHEKGHLTPLCRDAGATSGCIRHLALISTLSILCRNHITAFISHSQVFISGFSFKNSHFAPFRATWRHIDQLPVSCGTWRSSIFYLTCVRVLGVPLVYTPRSLTQVFP